jgi:glucosyl-dolichyl phosphate glucuronosyltransferase
MDASIIIVTRNRAADLKETLDAMKQVQVPDGMRAELLVVDNGSTDETSQVAQSVVIPRLLVRYLCEPNAGKTLGQNRGLAETTGKMILFTDDDVRPPPNWLAGMCGALILGKVDAVCGGVRIAPNLIRPWMTPMHRSWLASTEWLVAGNPQSMVGANMAFSRSVLSRVPGFDHELGPGAAGFGDDHLFASQLLAAGYKLHDRTDLQVEHHFDSSRLKREAWLSAAEKHGASHAYLGHHWEHWGYRLGKLRQIEAGRKLARWRSRHPDLIESEGCSEEELKLVYHWATVRGHRLVHRRRRNYERHGLVKLPELK